MPLRITLLSVRTATKSADYDSIIDDYMKRCGRDFPATSKTLRTEAALLEHVAAEQKREAAQLWIADNTGRALTSNDFATRIGAARDSGIRHLMLGIGPADGWSQTARAAATLALSFGAMTLPHELARLVLAEQIYRASTILAGHPYHLGH